MQHPIEEATEQGAHRALTGQGRQEQTLRALNEASIAVQQARTPDEVYDAVIHEMGSLDYHAFILELTFDGQHLRIRRTDISEEELARLVGQAGRSLDTYQVSLDSLPGHRRVIEQKRTLYLTDLAPFVKRALPAGLTLEPDQIVGRYSLHRAIVAPLVVAQQVKGILLVSAETLGQADVPAVTAFADQISAALDRARLFAELQEREWRATVAYEMAQKYADELRQSVEIEQQRRSELDRLNRALRHFANQLRERRDEASIAQLLCETVREALGWTRVIVSLRDYQTMTSRPVAQVGHPPEVVEQQMAMPPTPFGDAPWMREEFRISHSYYVADVPSMMESDTKGRVIDTGVAEQPKDLLAVPLEAGGRVLGILSPADRQDRQRPTRQQIEHLELFAAQAAIALESVQFSKTAQKWADAVRHSADAILITDLQGQILDVNPAFEALTGYGLEEAVGKTPHILNSELTPSGTFSEMWRTIRAGETWRGEVVNRRQDGSLYDADLTVAPILGADEEPIGFVSSQRDITRLKELDRLKAEFVSNVSHELRTPLANIKLYQGYLREKRRPSMRDQLFSVLKKETNRLEQIIEGLLDLSRLETGGRASHREALDLNEVAGEVVKAHAARAGEKDVTLRLEQDDALPLVMADRSQMFLVLNNLVDNAVNYTPPGGQVWVTTRRDREGVVLAVQDTGYGIAPEEKEHIFQRFYRGQAAGRAAVAGTGLGLAIVQQILVQHGAAIDVESQVGQGSTFSVTLSSLETPGPRPTVLLLADEPDELTTLLEYLAQASYHLIPTINVEEARLKVSKDLPDLFVVDLSSPDLAYEDVLNQGHFWGGGSSLRTLFLVTADTAPPLPERLSGPWAVLQMPCTEEQFLGRVRQLLNRDVQGEY